MEFPILQGDSYRCLEKSFLNLEPAWEVFMSSDALANLRN